VKRVSYLSGRLEVRKNGKCGFYDPKKSKWVIPPVYEDVEEDEAHI